MAFRGTFDHTFDAKNRLTVPVKFRASLSDGVVVAKGVERCVSVWTPDEYEAFVASALGQAELPDTPDWIAKLHKAAADESKLGACDQEQLRALASMLERDEASVLRVDVPAYPRDIHDIRGLARVAAILVPG